MIDQLASAEKIFVLPSGHAFGLMHYGQFWALPPLGHREWEGNRPRDPEEPFIDLAIRVRGTSAEIYSDFPEDLERGATPLSAYLSSPSTPNDLAACLREIARDYLRYADEVD